MDKPRIFLGSSGKQSKLIQAIGEGHRVDRPPVPAPRLGRRQKGEGGRRTPRLCVLNIR